MGRQKAVPRKMQEAEAARAAGYPHHDEKVIDGDDSNKDAAGAVDGDRVVLKRTVGLVSAVTLIVGNIIGTGE
jgi:hypothetical protein